MKKITLLFLFGIFNISLVISQPIANFNMSASSICGLGYSIVVTDVSTGFPTSWLWSVTPSGGVVITDNIAANTSITFNNAGMFSIKLVVTNILGTDSISKIVNVYDLPVTPSICMVTCDGGSVNNIVYWDKTGYVNVDSFIVYREVSPGTYSKIAVVSNDSLSEFVDTARSIGTANGDPNLASYKYKIQIRDLCGNFSLMSPYHNTIYIVDSGLGQFDWSIPYSIEGFPNPVVNYILLCDTLGVNIWCPSATVSGTSTSAVDPGFINHSTIANWRVKTGWSISCTPTRATINTTRSNIKHASTTTSTTVAADLNNSVLIYPNPTTESITIELSNLIQNGSIKIFNVMGQEVFETNINASAYTITIQHIDISKYAKGLYTVVIDNNKNKLYKKLLLK